MTFSSPAENISRTPLVSIIVNNYNYGRFLRDAIDSALAQTYQSVEVVVVDDGSTDESRDVIAEYGLRITPVLQGNGGQASAFNAGLAASLGEIVIFLDADDTLYPDTVMLAVMEFTPGIAKVHWALHRTNETLEPTGQVTPPEDLPFGDLRAETFRLGPATSLSPPTSGNAWARWFLVQVMPIPEDDHRIAADGYLYGLAPGFGRIGRLASPQGSYRIHSHNNYRRLELDERLRHGVLCMEHQWRVLRTEARRRGMQVDDSAWVKHSYFHQLRTATQELDSIVPTSTPLILIDESRWTVDGLTLGRQVLPFPECDGYYGGPPEDDSAAIAELDRLWEKYEGACFVVASPAFWWLEHYKGFAEYVRSHFVELLSNDRLIIFSKRNDRQS